MKKERLIILLGTLIALIFFYIGLNQWLERKPESAPPPVVVKPMPQTRPQEEGKLKMDKTEQVPTAQKEEKKPAPNQQKEDLIAKKIEEEKKKEGMLQKDNKKISDVRKPEFAPSEQRKNSATQNVQERKVKEGFKEEAKEYVIQIGAFNSKENAEKVLDKAKKMGYAGNIVSEDKFYKVRVKVKTNDPKKEIAKLRSSFGSAIIKQ